MGKQFTNQKTEVEKVKIQLLLYPPSLGPGGTERVVLNLCRHVSRDEFEISVCSMTDGFFADEIRELGIQVTILSKAKWQNNSIIGKVVNYLRMVRTLQLIISKGGPTVVHTHHYGPLLQLYLLRKFTTCRFGWIHTEHSWTDVHNASTGWLCRLLNPMRAVDIISGVAEKITSYMVDIAGSSSNKAMTVLNGIDTEQFVIGTRDFKKCELGFAPSDVVVGTIGMLRPEKNQQLLINAFALAAVDMSNLHLVICGDGVCRSELENLTASLCINQRVHFLGYRSDVSEILSVFDLYCLPSEYEGLPLSILEAWAARRPVVATEVIGNIDIISQEINGILVPLNDARKMADAILKLARDEVFAQAIAARGYEVVTSCYGIFQMVKRYEDLYRRIAI